MMDQRTFVMCLIVLCPVTPAVAQDKPLSAGIAYQFLELDDLPFPIGVNADVVDRLTPHVAVVGDIEWSWDWPHQFGLRDVTTALHAGGGVRWTAGRNRRA